MAMVRRIVSLWAGLVIACGINACRHNESEEAVATTASLPNPGMVLPGVTDSQALALTTAANRLTPEQISQQIRYALDFQYGWTDAQGRFHDTIVEQLTGPLGGIDFTTTQKRDSNTKVQTLLIIRRIAYDIAATVVRREANPDNKPKSPILFKHCDLATDRPMMSGDVGNAAFAEEREQRWRAQLEFFYWRFFARAPEAEEVNAMKNMVISVLQTEQWPPSGWVTVLYVLLSSAEFWNL